LKSFGFQLRQIDREKANMRHIYDGKAEIKINRELISRRRRWTERRRVDLEVQSVIY